MSFYNAVPATVDFPALEREIIVLWAECDTFAKSLENTHDGDPRTFYESPPTANGTPGMHHIEARVLKNLFPRFKTMQGRRVDRRAGQDRHGLPIELAAKKELGFPGEPDIEVYRVEPFNARYRGSVLRHVDTFAELIHRVGYWMDLDEAYTTMIPEYVQPVRWALKQISDGNLLQENYRVAPYCPRCGTTLSDHELAQDYEDVTDPPVYVCFPITSGPPTEQADLSVWITTPWALVSNTATAVYPDVNYVVGTYPEQGDLVVVEPLFDAVPGEEQTRGRSFKGSKMECWDYQYPFEPAKFPALANHVVLADYATASDGTSLVYQAPAFSEDGTIVCRSYDLPFVNPIHANGTFDDAVKLVGGVSLKDADAPLVVSLDEGGLPFRRLDYFHSYPHCRRCHIMPLYYVQPSRYIRTTHIKDQLLIQDKATTWCPESVEHGHYGDWFNNNIDWALSCSHHWGTPLPIWRNVDDPTDLICVDSLAELGELAGRDLSDPDPYRPFIDDIEIVRDGATYRRVSEVVDVWFDSGSMPFAQWGYPHVPDSVERLETNYPTDFICETIDQTCN